MGLCFAILVLFEAIFGDVEAILGLFWGYFGVIVGAILGLSLVEFGVIFGNLCPFGAFWGLCFGYFEVSWGLFGPYFGFLGTNHLGFILGLFYANFVYFEAMLGHFWGYVGSYFAAIFELFGG